MRGGRGRGGGVEACPWCHLNHPPNELPLTITRYRKSKLSSLVEKFTRRSPLSLSLSLQDIHSPPPLFFCLDNFRLLLPFPSFPVTQFTRSNFNPAERRVYIYIYIYIYKYTCIENSRQLPAKSYEASPSTARCQMLEKQTRRVVVGGREGEGGSELCAKALHRCYVQYVYTIYIYIYANRGVWKEEEGTMEGRLVLYKSLRCKRLRPSFHPCFRSTRAGRGEEGTIRNSSEIRKGIDTFD